MGLGPLGFGPRRSPQTPLISPCFSTAQFVFSVACPGWTWPSTAAKEAKAQPKAPKSAWQCAPCICRPNLLSKTTGRGGLDLFGCSCTRRAVLRARVDGSRWPLSGSRAARARCMAALSTHQQSLFHQSLFNILLGSRVWCQKYYTLKWKQFHSLLRFMFVLIG